MNKHNMKIKAYRSEESSYRRGPSGLEHKIRVPDASRNASQGPSAYSDTPGANGR